MAKQASGGSRGAQQWLRVLLAAAVLLVGLYFAWQRDHLPQQEPPQAGSAPAPLRLPQAPNNDPAERPTLEPEPDDAVRSSPRAVVKNQTIRDQDGRVVYRGDIDLGTTLDRISHDHKLRFSHDGAVFENRERRLPRQPPGYYHEYVHPTPGLSGPGPQRVVMGQSGETYYTPDHYRTFHRIDQP